MTDTSTTSDLLSTAAPAPAAAPSYQPVGMPVTPAAFDAPEAQAARAEIRTKIADRTFYETLKSERERGVTGPATTAWANLHKTGFPSATEIASQSDVDGQAAARDAEAWNGYVSTIKQDIPHLTEQQEAEIRAGITNQVSRDWALREKDRMIKDPSFRRKLLDGGRAEREDWARVNAILSMRVVRP
jgi:hypothetical protein